MIKNCCLPCLSVLSMHLAAWLSVLSCLVRLISLVHLVYLSCLIFPSRYFVSKDLVDDLTYMCTSAISVIGAGERKNVINVICSCSFACSSFSSSSYSSYPSSCSAPLSVPLRLSWVSAKAASMFKIAFHLSVCRYSQSVSQPASQLHIVCVEVPFRSIPPSTVQSRFVSFQRERESSLSLSLSLFKQQRES